jgi:hypothetical protein
VFHGVKSGVEETLRDTHLMVLKRRAVLDLERAYTFVRVIPLYNIKLQYGCHENSFFSFSFEGSDEFLF